MRNKIDIKLRKDTVKNNLNFLTAVLTSAIFLALKRIRKKMKRVF